MFLKSLDKIFFNKIFAFFPMLFLFSMGSLSQRYQQEQNSWSSASFFHKLYNFQFAEADSLIATIDSAEQSLHFNFLKAHYMRWYYLPIHQQNREILYDYRQYLEATAEIDIDSELSYFAINSALLKAEFHYNQGNYYKAFQNGAIVYEVVKDSLDSKPSRVEIKFLTALYHYYYHYYRAENPIFSPMMWFFKEGEKATGLKWLEEVAEERSLLSTEALVYLSHIYLRLENQPRKALNFAMQLSEKHPHNLKFYELLIESSLANIIENRDITERIKRLKESSKIYFRKYGVCYDAIWLSKFGSHGTDKKILAMTDALDFIQKNGGGNHLSSLLYHHLYELTANEEYLKQKNKLNTYEYVLTGYRLEKVID